MTKKLTSLALRCCLALAALLACCSLLVAVPQVARADETMDGIKTRTETLHIKEVSDFITAILASQGDNGNQYENTIIYLDNDLKLSTDDVDTIIDQIGSLTFNTVKNPFKGEFNGQGHTIIGLDYRRNLWVPKANTGLFAATDQAYIHDINFKDGYIGADFRGGYIVGLAEDSTIADIKITNCTSSVTPANNSVSLITNAGLAGGMVAGQTKGGVLHNIEVSGGRVVNNSTAGVSGLGGEGLYLGAIVGTAADTVIEYCRVTPLRDPSTGKYIDSSGNVITSADTSGLQYTEVYNKYDIAVGAVAGQAVYAGGIAGGIYNGTTVTDSFSTAYCHTYCGTYVSVGAGNVGYVGGIAARADNDSDKFGNCAITRCQFAGNLSSVQYNAALVIPIIQHDCNLAGILERDDDIKSRPTTVTDCYFKYGATTDLKSGRTINAVDDSAAGASYGPADAHYTDRDWWESQGYDFEGDQTRSTRYRYYNESGTLVSEHIDKWVMDDVLGMPVHGASVKATFDFPGAATVTMSGPYLAGTNGSESTSTPYDFAVIAALPSDTTLTLTAELTSTSATATPLVSDSANAGYAFRGWYLRKNVGVNHIDSTHDYFAGMTTDTTGTWTKVGESETLTRTNTGNGDWSEFKDNDLYVAYTQGMVLFHDVNGNQIDVDDGTISTDTSDDWYDHQATISPATPMSTTGLSDGATFLGWTTTPKSGTTGGYAAITSSELQALKNAKTFYAVGTAITVEQPMDLYPVYASYASNIITRIEGWDSDSDKTHRATVGDTSVVSNDGNYSIKVTGIGTDGALPDGYRFLGWYEIASDNTEVKVSNDMTYTLPSTVDLTAEHTYIARFEYRVDYYASLKIESLLASGRNYKYYCFASEWFTYEETISSTHASAIAPEDPGDHVIDHWSLNSTTQSNNDYGECSTGASDGNADGTAVKQPTCVYGHWDSGSTSTHNITFLSDFPNAAKLTESITTTMNDGYSFVAWTIQGQTTVHDGMYIDNVHESWTVSTSSWDHYLFEGRFVAKVKFHDAKNNELTFNSYRQDDEYYYGTGHRGEVGYSAAGVDPATGVSWTTTSSVGYVERRYGEAILSTSDIYYQYEYPVDQLKAEQSGTTVATGENGLSSSARSPLWHRSAASPTDASMQALVSDVVDTTNYDDGVGYEFVGWIERDALTDAAKKAIYGSVDKATGNIAVNKDVVEPYLIDEDDTCTRTMELYPVYVKYEFSATTNVARAGVVEGAGINTPANPYLVASDTSTAKSADGFTALTTDTTTGVTSRSVRLLADTSTKVTDGGVAYTLTSWTIKKTNNATNEETTETVSNAGNPYTFTLDSAYTYTFIANYEPLAVVYHVGSVVSGANVDTTTVVTKNDGDTLGSAPTDASGNASPFYDVSLIDHGAGDAATLYVFVGWTETAPTTKTTGYVLWEQGGTAGIKLVSEDTVVNSAMELWPVYRARTVKVNSSIDKVLKSDAYGYTENTITQIRGLRHLSKNGDTAGLKAEASSVKGYAFQGWYSGCTFDSDGNMTALGTPVSTSDIYVLSADEPFTDVLYTAVYEKVYDIRYHDTTGNVISTVKVKESDTRSFVADVEYTDGNGEKQKIENAIIDGEAYQAIVDALNALNTASNATVHEVFKEWQWVKTDGTAAAWSTFYKQNITQSMDLYPVTYQLSAKDATESNYTAKLSWQTDFSTSGSDAPIRAGFTEVYEGSKLTVHLDEASYAPEAAANVATGTGTKATLATVTLSDSTTAEGVNNVKVALYNSSDIPAGSSSSTGSSAGTATLIDTKSTGNGTDSSGAAFPTGDAIFELGRAGKLTITKTAPAAAAGSTVTFTVKKGSVDDGTFTASTATTDSMQVSCTLVANSDGTAATGTIVISGPFGFYQVTEDAWSWRYTPSYTVGGASGNVVEVFTTGSASVSNTEDTTKNQTYVDGEAERKHNVFTTTSAS